METRRLSYFMKIVECGSITQAARELGVAQPALSQQLSVLEHEVKAQLLLRSRSGTVPTPAGMRLYERAKRIVREVSSLERELSGEERGGVFSIGFVPSVMAALGLPFLQRMLKEHPKLMPQIIEAPAFALRDLLGRGLVDVGVLPTSLVSSELQTAEIYADHLRIIGDPRRLSTAQSPRELATLPWLVTRAPNSIRNALSAWFARHGLEPNIVAEIDSLPLVLDAVLANLGVTLISSSAIPAHVDCSGLQGLPLPGGMVERSFFACWRTGSQNEAVRAMVAILLDIGQGIRDDPRFP